MSTTYDENRNDSKTTKRADDINMNKNPSKHKFANESIHYKHMGTSSGSLTSVTTDTLVSGSGSDDDGYNEDDEDECSSDEEFKSDDYCMQRPVKPLSDTMKKEYCRQVKKWGGQHMSSNLAKTILGWNHNYDRFSRVNQAL
ncbi:hypothetical protein ACOMHN_018655 [Nucella lapillus]